MDGDKAQGKGKLKMGDIWKRNMESPGGPILTASYYSCVIICSFFPTNIYSKQEAPRRLGCVVHSFIRKHHAKCLLTSIAVSPLSLSIFPKTVE